MKPGAHKLVSITPPAAIVDNAAFTTATLDTLGFRHAEIIIYFGAMDIAATVCKVTESNDSGMSGATDVPGCVCATSTDIDGTTSVLPTATYDNTFVKFEIPLQGRKRYLDLSLTGGDGAAGTYAAAFALLYYPDTAPNTSAKMGCSEVLRANQ